MLKNLTPGTVLLIGVLGLAAGWMAGTSTASNQQQGGAAARPRSGPRPLGSPENVAPLTRELRERLDSQPTRVTEGGRNPFVFGSRRAPSAPRLNNEGMAAPAPAPAFEPVPYTPPAPQIKLSGIAASHEAGATVLTAIVNDNGALAFVKIGDKLPSGATVIKIDETSVVVMDAAGITQTIRLP